MTLFLYFHIFKFKEKEALGYVWYDVAGIGIDITAFFLFFLFFFMINDITLLELVLQGMT